ncbi:MAG TPA: alpha/beta hydrolase [Elusimicrobia bacterium]|nr:alpha/beta hydrolase [Elusimicrobiota bacterium]HBT60603.1 alpha/beta hydrolase [Elusimicrobiota bacterium]
MKNLRIYGKAPHKLAVLHGGPGAAGEMEPVARELSRDRGVLEPLQTAASVDGQVAELRAVLRERGDLPVTLIGFSWGAWLGYIFAARHPEFVNKLILIGSGGFEESSAVRVQETRLGRLSREERAEAESLVKSLESPVPSGRHDALPRLGEIFRKADAYDPLPCEPEGVEIRAEIFKSVWREAAQLRKSGQLLELGKRVLCPVAAIHGAYDPHPAEGVEKPLASVLRDFRFILLQRCGHKPWIERQAKADFFACLRGLL